MGVCKRTREEMPGECRGPPRDFDLLSFPVGGTPGECPIVHQPWGNDQERDILPLYSHCQDAMQSLDGLLTRYIYMTAARTCGNDLVSWCVRPLHSTVLLHCHLTPTIDLLHAVSAVNVLGCRCLSLPVP